jgi:hypothetical protein
MAFLESVSKQSVWTFFVCSFIELAPVKMMAPSFLPRSLSNTWKFAAVRHFTEADATDSKLLVDSVRTTATLATCIAANLELRLASSFNLE